MVFFKPVYSKIKFWQMIGRGTRLCPDLFGPEDDKQDFRVFDFCFNFDFFKENPEGINAGDSAPLGTRLFRARVQLVGHVQTNLELDPDAALRNSVTDGLHGEVAAMNRENFIVRMHLETVERFQDRGVWEQLSEGDRETLQREVAGLPSEIATDDIESRLFDLTALRMQLALVEGDEGAFESHRKRVVEIAMLLEEKGTIPAVAAQLEYIAGVQESAFWEGIAVAGLEELRLRLRGLVPFLDRKKRKIVYTDFKDEVLGVREEQAVLIPKMTGAQYAKKVNDYLRNHLTHIVIHRLRTNQPLSIPVVDIVGQPLGQCSFLVSCAHFPSLRSIAASRLSMSVNTGAPNRLRASALRNRAEPRTKAAIQPIASPKECYGSATRRLATRVRG